MKILYFEQNEDGEFEWLGPDSSWKNTVEILLKFGDSFKPFEEQLDELGNAFREAAESLDAKQWTANTNCRCFICKKNEEEDDTDMPGTDVPLLAP